MNSPTMHEANQSALRWQLAANDVRRLPPLPLARWLTVQQGRLWVTADGAAPGMAQDIWLLPGDALRLPPGSAWWVEAWPEAEASLLEEPPRRRDAPWWRRWLDTIAPPARPQPAACA